MYKNIDNLFLLIKIYQDFKTDFISILSFDKT
jgi:hypothetical protein